MNKLLGVVLCGGLSTRMGEDKGMLKVQEEERWAEKMDSLLSEFVPTVLSINDSQVNVYRNFFMAEKLVLDIHYENINGPLRGLLSVHENYPDYDLIVLPCDMINFTKEALEIVIKTYTVDKKHEVIAPFVNNYLQPLATIYKARGMARIKGWVKEGNSLKNRSMMHVLRRMHTLELPFSDDYQHVFKNFNSPGDFSEEKFFKE